METVPEEVIPSRIDDCRTSYRSYSDRFQYTLVTDSTANPGRQILVLHAIREILPHPSTVYDVPSWIILEANNGAGKKSKYSLV
jgi:hypothetical protein